MRIGNENIDLKLSLTASGQCFRWIEREGRFGCVLNGRPVWLYQDKRGICTEGTEDAAFLRDYLDLNRDYKAIALEYAHIPQVRSAIEAYPGLRVLNQPTWETLISFILSANNNIARITSLVHALCRRFGEEINGLYSFPTPEQLADATVEELRALKVGYRAPYLIGAAKMVCDGFDLEALPHLPREEAHRCLLTLPGVGDKVADCILLFGCRQASAFPVEVWVERVMREQLQINCKSRVELCRKSRTLFGDHARIAQRFLFHVIGLS